MFKNLFLIKESHSVAFADFVRSRESLGHKIIKMQTGDPDFDTHPAIISAATCALTSGQTKYSDSRGLMDLRKALVEKLVRENNIQISPKENILVTHGAVHAVNMAIRAIINFQDECIIIEPFWRAYEANVILCGGTPIIVKAVKNDKFQLNAENIINKFSSRTKLIIINTPNNPSGAVYSKVELDKLAYAAKSKGIYILSDEVYETVIFGEKKHYSVASNLDVNDSIISVFSFSKTFSMTGWRIGYVVAPKKIIDQMLKLSQFSITSLSPFNQIGAFAALTDYNSQNYKEFMRNEYEKRKSLIQSLIEGTWLEDACVIPDGTFYLLIDMSRFGLKSLDLAKKIVEISNISFSPGIAFGNEMDEYLRMCFATSCENIELAIDVLLNLEIN